MIKVGLALSGIFVAGAVAGAFGGVAWKQAEQERTAAERSSGRVREFVEGQLRRRITDLELTPEQVDRVRPIMLEFEEQLRGCRRKAMTEVSDVSRAMNARLEEQLTPAQIEKFRDIVTKERERMEKEMQRRSPQRRDGDRPPGSSRDTLVVPGTSSGPETVVSPPSPAPAPTTP